MSRKIKIGIIGAGRIGKMQSENIVKYINNVEIKTIAEIFVDKIKDWALDLGIKRVTDNYKEILSDSEIKAVLILSSTETHTKMIIESAKVRKHIFCEKPIDVKVDIIKEALKEVKKAGVKLQVGFVRRFDRNFRKVKELVENGEIGKPYIIKITSRDPDLQSIEYHRTAGGMFLDCTIHDFDMMRYLSGSEVIEVYAIGNVLVNQVFKEFDDVDTSIVTLKFKSGAIGVIDNCRRTGYGYDQRVEVFGSKGCIIVGNEIPTTLTINTKKGVCKDKPKWFFTERYNDAFISELKEFFDAILYDKKPLVTGIDGLKSVEIAIAAQK